MATEVALAVVLLVGAGLMVRGFQKLVSASPALEPSTMLTMHLSLADDRDPVRYYRQVLDGLAVLPGVRSAFAVTALPYSRHAGGSPIGIEGRPVEPGRPLAAMIQSRYRARRAFKPLPALDTVHRQSPRFRGIRKAFQVSLRENVVAPAARRRCWLRFGHDTFYPRGPDVQAFSQFLVGLPSNPHDWHKALEGVSA